MNVVTEEMVEVAFKAARQGQDALAPGWMQRALAAVAPLIAAQERERCAVVVEAHQAEVQRNIDDNISEVRVVQIVPSDNWPLIKARDWLKHTAAALRAL
jgi:hypothetical protein